MTRRNVLKILLLGSTTPTVFFDLDLTAEAATIKSICTGKLTVHNVHTDESLKVRYLNKRGGYDRNAVAMLTRVFRCPYTHQTHPIDPRLFLLLDAVRSRLGALDRPYQLISGYRSPEYNKFLRSQSQGVARNSYHLKGKAADVRIEGVKLADLQRIASRLKLGGVGSYEEFIHLDLGPVRHWEG